MTKGSAGHKKFRYAKMPGASFKGQNLQYADFRSTSLVGVDFTDCDLSYADFEAANLYGANFTNAKCYRTNFKDADLSESTMHAKELFGATFSLNCKSFKGMKVLPGWWYTWLFFGHLMKAPSQEEDLKLIELLGAERFATLRKNFVREI